ncbi:DUF3052 family protein [Aggregicoccus sp. 17bor-14]|uniref:DUF3052 family protein n=1 Tax=Myxococcaceae TaxID=31 RepID=UPI00129C55CD|nr:MULTISPECIES: DUF3052 family protein [Myxococcaceae]MBF5044380.1 DUF3052 family protein [Simulacricoccus sp. 17bor-14]MRI90127.1 DUF3052 family protein [Aggregicoccus sp. 17bor-14]
MSGSFGLGAPLPTLLGIRAGHKVSVINPPPGFVHRLNPLPDGVEFLVTAQAGLDVILFFTRDARELVERLPALSRAMAVTGGIWVCWPADATGRPPVSEDLVRQAALEIGLVDNKIAHLDATWTGLRLVWRPKGRLEKPERPKERPKDVPTAQAGPAGGGPGPGRAAGVGAGAQRGEQNPPSGFTGSAQAWKSPFVFGLL